MGPSKTGIGCVSVDGFVVQIGPHCADRYFERVFPVRLGATHGDRRVSNAKLREDVRQGRIVKHRPGWCSISPTAAAKTDFYLCLKDDVVLTLRWKRGSGQTILLAITCIPRRGEKTIRNGGNRQRRASRRRGPRLPTKAAGAFGDDLRLKSVGIVPL